jgi:hypothetical protein
LTGCDLFGAELKGRLVLSMCLCEKMGMLLVVSILTYNKQAQDNILFRFKVYKINLFLYLGGFRLIAYNENLS